MRLLLLFAAVIVLLPTPWCQQMPRGHEPNSRGNKANNTADHQQQPQQPASSSTTTPEIRSEIRQAASDDSTSDKNEPPSQKWIVRFTAVLAAVAVFQFAAMIAQYIAMHKQADYMRRGLRISLRAARAAKISANAAKLSVDLMIHKERARIFIGDIEDFDPSERAILAKPNDLIKFKVICYGTTPAFIDESLERVLITNDKETPRPTVLVPLRLPKIIQPNSDGGIEAWVWIFDKLDTATVEAIDAGNSHVHFFGHIKYRDVFDQPHETIFRYRWRAYDWKKPLTNRQAGIWEQHGGEEENKTT